MSKAIIYCEKCGNIIPPSEFERGRAMVFENVGVCPQCVASLSSAEREEIERRFSPQPAPAIAARRGRATTARKARPSQRTEGAPARPAAGHGSGRGLAVAGIVAGLLAGAAIAVVLATGRTDSPSEAPDQPVERGGVARGEHETPGDPAAPVKTEARSRLYEIKSMTAKPLERYAEARAALTKFIEGFGDAPEAAEAKELLAKIDADFGKAADEALEKAAASARALAADGKFAEARKALGGIRERFGESGWFERSGEEAVAGELAKVDAAHAEAAKALLARARAAFDSRKLGEARAALGGRAGWPEGLRASADGLLKEVGAAEAKLEAERKAKERREEAWEAFLLGFPEAGRQSLAKARAFLQQERKAFEKLGSGGEIARKLDLIERRFRAAKLVEELAEVGFRGARGTIYLNWKDAKVGGKIKKVDNGVLWLMTTRGRNVSVPIAEIAGADVVQYSRTMQQGSRERLRAASYLLLRGDLAAAREAIKDAAGDAAWALSEQIDEFTKAVEAREARLAAAEAARRAAETTRLAAKANALATAAAARESAALKVGLVGHWKLDEGRGAAARDSSGRGNHGVVRGARWVDGRFGGALEFDGRGAFVDVTNRNVAVRGDAARTVAAWVKTSGGPRVLTVVATGNGANDQSFNLRTGDGIVGVMGFFNDFYPGHGARVNDGAWHHIAAVYDGAGTVTTYVDGRRDNSASKQYATSGQVNLIGKSNDSRYAFPYRGLIDEVRIYERALSSDEMKVLFEGPRPAPGAAPTKGLVAHWKFDDGGGTVARDSSGKGNHGAVHGGAKWTQGKRGGALEFDGTDDYVAIANEANFDITGNITVAAWIKVASFTKKWQVIVTKGGRCWRLQRDAGRRSLEWACTGLSHNRSGNVHGSVAVNDGRWHHIAGVYDGTETCLYVDGKVDASARASGAILTNDYKVYIGDGAQGGGRHFHGLIDDVRVYDRALSSDEIGMLVEGPRPAPVAAPTEGLIGHWKFDEPAGVATAKDETGGNNGTNVGVTTGAPGKIGGAYSFDGGGDSVSVGTWDVPEFTLDQWINWEGGAGIRTVISKGGRWDLWIEERNLRLRRNGSLSTFGDYRPPVGEWVRLTVTYDGTNAVLYVDGAYEGEGKFSMAGATGATVKIGEQTNGGGCFNGLIDDVRVYDRALSAAEVKALFEGRSPAPGTGPTEGLVCHWKFDEPAGARTAVDSSGGGHNGNNLNVATGLPGRVGRCYGFNGSSSHVEVPSLGLTFAKATFAVWVNIDEIQQNNDSIIHTDDYEGGSVHYMFGGSRHLYFCVQGCGKPRSKTVFTADDIGKWVHVAATYDSTVSPPITHYRNGLPDGTGGKQGRTLDFTSPSDIGSLNTSRWFKGRMDDFRIYDRALSPEEMKALAGVRAAAPGSAPAAGRLVCHWKFDEGTGTVAKDASGTGSDGTLRDARWTAGRLGRALDFDGARAGVDCPAPAGLTLAEATVAFWARVPSAGWKPWRDWWELGTAKGFIFGELAGKNEGAAAGTPALYGPGAAIPGATFLQQQKPVLPGTGWRHIAYTMSASGNKVKLLVDGKVVNSNRWSAKDAVTSISLGYARRRGGNHVRSTMDDVRIYSRALSDKEIKALFEEAGPASAPAPGATMAQTLVGHWKLDDGRGYAARDSSGNRYHARIKGAKWTVGKLGRALEFDGTDMVTLPLNVLRAVDAGDKLSVGMWIKPKDLKSEMRLLDTKGTAGSRHLTVSVVNGGNLWVAAGGVVGGNVKAVTQWTAGKWQHFVLTYDGTVGGGTYKVYRNGAESGRRTGGGRTFAKELVVGAKTSAGRGGGFKGAIDDVRVYKRALTAGEVARLASGGE